MRQDYEATISVDATGLTAYTVGSSKGKFSVEQIADSSVIGASYLVYGAVGEILYDRDISLVNSVVIK